jgi:hypothetical protein
VKGHEFCPDEEINGKVTLGEFITTKNKTDETNKDAKGSMLP